MLPYRKGFVNNFFYPPQIKVARFTASMNGRRSPTSTDIPFGSKMENLSSRPVPTNVTVPNLVSARNTPLVNSDSVKVRRGFGVVITTSLLTITIYMLPCELYIVKQKMASYVVFFDFRSKCDIFITLYDKSRIVKGSAFVPHFA